ncbi:hypothetical protein QBC35DRAFT_476567 [Podospora australis]|uniref:SRR1-like domain-containing protein n=1 Tax=Podospora australis TaxID=1536484 RepID=A0AAN6WP75_9PEZI|nr:hypothetical protein QBC35DRAFT_476567 [Podospora australis]
MQTIELPADKPTLGHFLVADAWKLASSPAFKYLVEKLQKSAPEIQNIVAFSLGSLTDGLIENTQAVNDGAENPPGDKKNLCTRPVMQHVLVLCLSRALKLKDGLNVLQDRSYHGISEELLKDFYGMWLTHDISTALININASTLVISTSPTNQIRSMVTNMGIKPAAMIWEYTDPKLLTAPDPTIMVVDTLQQGYTEIPILQYPDLIDKDTALFVRPKGKEVDPQDLQHTHWTQGFLSGFRAAQKDYLAKPTVMTVKPIVKAKQVDEEDHGSLFVS